MVKKIVLLLLLFCSYFILYAQESPQFGVFSFYYPNKLRPDKDYKLFVWENTCQLSEYQFPDSLVNDRYLRCKYSPVKNWYGFGYCAQPESPGTDLSKYINGYLCFSVRTTTGILTKVGIKSGESIFGEEAWISDLYNYGFLQNGLWNEICIPISNFLNVNKRLDLTSISQYFMVAGEGLSQINIVDFYNIYWTTEKIKK